MNILFTGAKSNSGYGQATDAFKRAFQELRYFNISYNISNDIINYDKNIKYDIEFVIGPPSNYVSKAKYKIIYFYWETDRLPDQWVQQIHGYNEIWAPCKLVEDVCLKSGYNKEIKIIPTPCLIDDSFKSLKLKNSISNYFLNPEYYKFYSIFQWQPRKGYLELLTAYFEEFQYNDEVVLVIKTNLISQMKEKEIIDTIKNIKKEKNSNAKVFLITDYLSNIDLFSLHKYGDCFVLPHYGEGWGMPIHEAAHLGNPIITTKYGGVTEFLNNNVYWIDHKMVSVSGMEWNKVYSSNQNWAKPNIESLKKHFRDVYNNRIKKSFSFNNFSIKNVSSIIEERLKEIGH
jgi:glycosyltransferase involved in cell wall biosynthesis